MFNPVIVDIDVEVGFIFLSRISRSKGLFLAALTLVVAHAAAAHMPPQPLAPALPQGPPAPSVYTAQPSNACVAVFVAYPVVILAAILAATKCEQLLRLRRSFLAPPVAPVPAPPRGFTLFWAFGIPVRGSPSALLLPALAGAVAAVQGLQWRDTVVYLFTCGPVLWASVLLHELGHAAAAMRLRAVPTVITLAAAGGCVEMEDLAGISNAGQVFISLAGPVVHLPQAGFWALMRFRLLGGRNPADAQWCTFAIIFQALMLLNLVPAVPLDGGTIALHGLLAAGVPRRAADAAVACCTALVAGLLILLPLGYVLGRLPPALSTGLPLSRHVQLVIYVSIAEFGLIVILQALNHCLCQARAPQAPAQQGGADGVDGLRPDVGSFLVQDSARLDAGSTRREQLVLGYCAAEEAERAMVEEAVRESLRHQRRRGDGSIDDPLNRL